MLRAQLVIALVLGFTVLAVLLYLWRRPSGTEHDGHDAMVSASASAAVAPPVIVRTKVEVPKVVIPRVKVGPVQHVRCGASAKASGEGNLCDSLPYFEQALTKAVEDTADCAPKPKSDDGSINFVLVVDFRAKQLRVYPGRSGTWKGKQAKAATECVKKAIAAPSWETVSHQYRHYLLATLATYPVQDTKDNLPNFQ